MANYTVIVCRFLFKTMRALLCIVFEKCLRREQQFQWILDFLFLCCIIYINEVIIWFVSYCQMKIMQHVSHFWPLHVLCKFSQGQSLGNQLHLEGHNFPFNYNKSIEMLQMFSFWKQPIKHSITNYSYQQHQQQHSTIWLYSTKQWPQ
jgi:hypothetical protein